MPTSLPRSASAIGNRPRTSTAPRLAEPGPMGMVALPFPRCPDSCRGVVLVLRRCFRVALLLDHVVHAWRWEHGRSMLPTGFSTAGARSIPAALRDRHWFYLRHRKPFLIAWVIAAVPLAYLILLPRAAAAVRDRTTSCLPVGIAYFLFIHGRLSVSERSRRFFPKGTGCRISLRHCNRSARMGALTHGPRPSSRAVLTFGAACWLNCVAIQSWEDAEAAQEIVHTILSATPLEPAPTRPHGLTELLASIWLHLRSQSRTLSLALADRCRRRRLSTCLSPSRSARLLSRAHPLQSSLQRTLSAHRCRRRAANTSAVSSSRAIVRIAMREALRISIRSRESTVRWNISSFGPMLERCRFHFLPDCAPPARLSCSAMAMGASPHACSQPIAASNGDAVDVSGPMLRELERRTWHTVPDTLFRPP